MRRKPLLFAALFALLLAACAASLLLGASGLLSHADRDLLVQGGVEMPGSYENRTLL